MNVMLCVFTISCLKGCKGLKAHGRSTTKNHMKGTSLVPVHGPSWLRVGDAGFEEKIPGRVERVLLVGVKGLAGDEEVACGESKGLSSEQVGFEDGLKVKGLRGTEPGTWEDLEVLKSKEAFGALLGLLIIAELPGGGWETEESAF